MCVCLSDRFESILKRDRGETVMKGEEASLRLARAERELTALKISSDRALKDLLDARNDFAGNLISRF